MPDRDRAKLDAVVERLQIQYGPRAVRKASLTPEPVGHLATGFPLLDAALGIGGAPRGRLTEFIGAATCGKSTVAAKLLAGALAEDRNAVVAWVDIPHACDPEYLHCCGMDLSRLLVVQPHSGADALAITVHLVESKTLAGLVFDGLADLAAEDEPVLTGTLERLAASVTATETAVVFLTEPAAQSQTLAHLAAVRLAFHRQRWIMAQGDVRGYEGQVEVLKHKLGRAGALVPYRIAFDDMIRGEAL